jgi:16S rRNA processing protein RimM
VARAHGIKGEVKVQPDFGSAEDFLAYKKVWLGHPDTKSRQVFEVVRCRPQASIVILALKDVKDRTMAESLAGREVLIEKNSLPKLADGEHYWHDLVGMQVETENGRRLGQVENLFATGAHDILVVIGGGHEYLIPLKKEFLLKKDAENGILTVAEVPGLFELND